MWERVAERDGAYGQHSGLPRRVFNEMAHFFTVYKTLAGKETAAGEVSGRAAAEEVVRRTIEHHIECFCR